MLLLVFYIGSKIQSLDRSTIKLTSLRGFVADHSFNLLPRVRIPSKTSTLFQFSFKLYTKFVIEL